MRLLRFGLVLFCLTPFLHTPLLQAQSAAPQLSPKAAYDDAMRPFEATRRSISNWSDIEIDALKVTISRAATACRERDVKTLTGADLIDYARLCALGQQWPTVVVATDRYIKADAPEKPLLKQAYVAKVDAELHIKDEPNALTDALAMLKAVPYDQLVAQAVDETVDFMELMYTADALTLEAARQPILLKKFAAAASTSTKLSPQTQPPPQTLHELYAEGLIYASIQQLANKPADAAKTLAELHAILPEKLNPDDLIPIAAARRRYSFLGKPLPSIEMRELLSLPNRLPDLPAQHAVTALLLFPDWCTQCVRIGKDFPQTVFQVEGHEAYFYGLMAETLPPATKVTVGPGEAPPRPGPRQILAETPTVIVPPSVLTQFAAEDFPLLIMADSHGIVRIVQSVSDDVLQPGGTMDTAVARIAATWPLAAPAAPKSAPALPSAGSH